MLVAMLSPTHGSVIACHPVLCWQVCEPRVLFGLRSDARELATGPNVEAWMWGGLQTEAALEKFAREGETPAPCAPLACLGPQLLHQATVSIRPKAKQSTCDCFRGADNPAYVSLQIRHRDSAPAGDCATYMLVAGNVVCCADSRLQALPFKPVVRRKAQPVYPEELEDGLARYSSAMQVGAKGPVRGSFFIDSQHKQVSFLIPLAL